MNFHKATKAKSKLRAAICGPAGSGKTYTALSIATNLGCKVAVVDTESGSASKYSDLFGFDTIEFSSFHPQYFIDAIKAAEDGGYDVIVLDSLSHAWAGKDGVLEQADAIAKRMKSGNSFTAWKEATPLQKSLIDSILQSKIHVIATMRSKMEYILEAVTKDGRTTQQPRRVGMAPVQRDDVQYEFDIVGEMDADNSMVIVKTRCSSLANAVIRKPGKELADTLKEWLSDGVPQQPIVPPQKVETAPVVEEKVIAPTAAAPDAHLEKLKKKVFATMKTYGVTAGDLKEWSSSKIGKNSTKEWDISDCDEALGWLESQVPVNGEVIG